MSKYVNILGSRCSRRIDLTTGRCCLIRQFILWNQRYDIIYFCAGLFYCLSDLCNMISVDVRHQHRIDLYGNPGRRNFSYARQLIFNEDFCALYTIITFTMINNVFIQLSFDLRIHCINSYCQGINSYFDHFFCFLFQKQSIGAHTFNKLWESFFDTAKRLQRIVRG